MKKEIQFTSGSVNLKEHVLIMTLTLRSLFSMYKKNVSSSKYLNKEKNS